MDQQDTSSVGQSMPGRADLQDRNVRANVLRDNVDLDEDPRDLEIGRLRADLAAARAREQALNRELQLRVRNTLSMVRSICRRTLENGASPDAFAEHFIGRLDAIARYQARPGSASNPAIELEDLVRDELVSMRCLEGPNCSVEGPKVLLGGKTLELVALAIHELATNSVKFGALCYGGHLAIHWRDTRSKDHQVLQIRWAETGVAPVSVAPRPSGFGRHLIEYALPYELGASTTFALLPGGFECTMSLTLPGPDIALERQDASSALSDGRPAADRGDHV